MLPQMMPLPWVIVFFFMFTCMYSFYLYLSILFSSFNSSSNVILMSKVSIIW